MNENIMGEPIIDERDAEIARLRAEVERLSSNPAWGEVDGLRQVVNQLERERDEALAQVAVLLSHVEVYLRWLHAPCEGQSGAHIAENEKAALSALEQIVKSVPAKARALLARLQRAEAAVGILDRCDNARHETTCECRKLALAVWEEGGGPER